MNVYDKDLINTLEISCNYFENLENEDFVREVLMVEKGSFEDLMINHEGLESFVNYNHEVLMDSLNYEVECEVVYAKDILKSINKTLDFDLFILDNGRHIYHFEDLQQLAEPVDFGRIDEYRIGFTSGGNLCMEVISGNGGTSYRVMGANIPEGLEDLEYYDIEEVLDKLEFKPVHVSKDLL